MEENNGSTFVRISNREIWDKLTAVEAKVDKLTILYESDQEDRELLKKDVNKRLQSLELRFYGILAGLVGSIVVIIRLAVQAGIH